MMLKGLQALLHSCKHRYRGLGRLICELKRGNKFTLTWEWSESSHCACNSSVSLSMWEQTALRLPSSAEVQV
jgi:hypothetical protein